MDVLIHWHETANFAHDTAEFSNVDAITCDGETVTLIQPDDMSMFPLRWIAGFQLLDEDL